MTPDFVPPSTATAKFVWNFDDFRVVRSWKGGVLFYVAWLIGTLFVVGVAGLVGGLLASFFTSDKDLVAHDARIIGKIIGVIVSVVVAALSLRAKNIKGMRAFLYIVAAVGASVVGGATGGLIVPSVLSTRLKVIEGPQPSSIV